MKRAFLYIVAVMLYCNPVWADETDPNLIWKTENSFLRFLVHPNGNIIAGKGEIVELGSTEFEIDGNTGMVIREFDSPMLFFDISPNGRYISANDANNWKCVVDYETGEIIHRFVNEKTKPKFMPDSKTLVYYVIEPIGELNGNTRLQSYNIETGEYKTSETFVRYTRTGAISVSPDGKYVATGGTFYGPDGIEYNRLILWDAETLDTIRILNDFKSGHVRSIKFSPDSKLVGFQVYWSDLYLYKTDDYSLYKHYNGDNILNGVMGFGFIANDFIAVGSDDNNQQNFEIINLNNNLTIYKRNDFTGLAEYNAFNNSLIVLRVYIHCFDFEKILSGASIEPEIPNPFTIEYLNYTLSIRNFIFGSNPINCSITDINGRVIRNMNLAPSTGDIRIPIKLLSGAYFLHIKDGSKEYVSKFNVTN
jgi:WD40 repeat protein